MPEGGKDFAGGTGIGGKAGQGGNRLADKGQAGKGQFGLGRSRAFGLHQEMPSKALGRAPRRGAAQACR
ncbi:hypothetical protein AB838_09205 [Rhodobacteraceae bacterium (ex Bugula neritina AB1)]|nr:hypothetical protein AB838_09205 [Rhodobacteraceae bacterium (ex Bugula neritina AB1)]